MTTPIKQVEFGDQHISEFNRISSVQTPSFICSQNPINFDPTYFSNLFRTPFWKHGAWTFFVFFWEKKQIDTSSDYFSRWYPLLDLIDKTDSHAAGLTRLIQNSNRCSLNTPNRKYFQYMLRNEDALAVIHDLFFEVASSNQKKVEQGS